MTVFDKITDLLHKNDVSFRVCEHQPEGRSDLVAKIRGNDPGQALKAMVVMAKLNKKDRKYYLAILPGNRSLDMSALKQYSGALDGVMLAPVDRVKLLTECEIGAVPPFSFNENLHIVADPSVKNNQEVVFNAGALDKSIFMQLDDYIKIVQPPFVTIVKAC